MLVEGVTGGRGRYGNGRAAAADDRGHGAAAGSGGGHSSDDRGDVGTISTCPHHESPRSRGGDP
jgi:hypothetical protein